MEHRLLENEEAFDFREFERVILGSILVNPALIYETTALGVMDFTAPFHRAVFGAMLALGEDGHPVDPVLIFQLIGNKKEGWSVSSITNLTIGLPHVRSIRTYVDVLKENAAKRSAIAAGEKLLDRLASGKIELKQFVTDLDSLGSELRDMYAEETDSFRPLSRVFQDEVIPTLDNYFRQKVSDILVSTGFREIDELLGGGLYPSDFLAIVAPPKSAKSALGLQMALAMAKNGETVGMLSLEMSNLQNALRLISQESFCQSVAETSTWQDAISTTAMRPGMHDRDHARATKVAASLFFDNFLICQKPLEWKEVQAEVRRLKKEKGLTVLIVDYWQLVRYENNRFNKADALAEIAKGLKRLGQELSIVVIALGQFNQEGLRKRESGGELSVNYLEGSGELVKSANIVLTIDIKDADLKNPAAPREGTLTFKPLRSASDGRLGCYFIGRYLTVEIK